MSTTEQTFVIMGAGLAGVTAAQALRTEGFGGCVVLLGEESEHPYDRSAAVQGLPADGR